MQTTTETGKDQRLGELFAELDAVKELLRDEAKSEASNPEYTDKVRDLSEAIDKMQVAVIGELLRAHPEYFRQLPK
jgi:hypothetical protein